MNFLIPRTGIWFDLWVLLALILLAVVIIFFIVRRRKLLRTEEELQDLLDEKYGSEDVGEKMDEEIEEPKSQETEATEENGSTPME